MKEHHDDRSSWLLCRLTGSRLAHTPPVLIFYTYAL